MYIRHLMASKAKGVRVYQIRVDGELNRLAITKRKEDIERLCTVVADPREDSYNNGIDLGINLGRKVYDARQAIFKISAHDLDYYFIDSIDEVRSCLDLCRDLPEAKKS